MNSTEKNNSEKLLALITSGTKTRDTIEQDYYEKRRNGIDVARDMRDWINLYSVWYQECLDEFEKMFVNPVLVVNKFKNPPMDAVYSVGQNAQWAGIMKNINARLEVLSELFNNEKVRVANNVTHIHGDQITGDKISDNTFGAHSINVIKSENVNIIHGKFDQLYKEIVEKYQQPDKEELLGILDKAKENAKTDGNKNKALAFMGALLTRTAEFATIGSLATEIIQILAGR